MDTFHVFITVLVVLIILAIVIGIGWWVRNHVRQEDIPPPNPLLTTVSQWSKPAVPSTDPTKNVCSLYEFPSSSVIIGGVPTFVPGVATLNAETLNNLTGESTQIPLCVDADQIVAEQVMHTCRNITPPDTTPITGPALISLCETLQGERVEAGTTEVFYQRCNHPTCPGEMSLVSVNYQVPKNLNPNCITRQANAGDPMLMSLCDPNNTQQRFRLTRINPGQNPNGLVAGQGQSGIIAQIVDRNTGLCLRRGENKTTTDFDPNYAQCGTGPIQPQEGWEVVLGPCTFTGTLGYPGYNWLLIPSFEYCGVAGGCNGCSGGIFCQPVPDTGLCQGSAGCTGAIPIVVAPQLIYLGDIDISTIPIGSAGYQGVFGLNAIYKWAIDKGATALYYGGSGTGLILRELAGNISQCINSGYVSQYLNISTYNQLAALKVCIAGEPATEDPCVSL